MNANHHGLRWIASAALVAVLTGCAAKATPDPVAQPQVSQQVAPPEAVPCSAITAEERAVGEWWKGQAVPLKAVVAGTGFADLEPLKAVLADVRVVGLGETTHGTREFFTMKHRMLEFLVKEMGYRLFAMEASYSESLAVNEYVLTGKGDPERLLEGLGFWTWQTQEVADLLRWMQQYNASAPADQQVQFIGFDIQRPRAAAINVEALMRKVAPAEWGAYESLVREVGVGARSVYTAALADKAANLKHLKALSAFLEENQPNLASQASPTEAEQAISLARQLWRYYDTYGGTDQMTISQELTTKRDRYMADTLLETLQSMGAGTKAVLWAHNVHISNSEYWMGTHLKQALGEAYYAFGFGFKEGAFQSMDRQWVLTEFAATALLREEAEWLLDCAGLQESILNLRQDQAPPAVVAWLKQERPLRSIGATYDPSQWQRYYAKQPLTIFDGLIYIPATTRARPF